MKKYQDTIFAKAFECDSKNTMKADFVLKHMQEAATNQLRAEGIPYDALLERGIAFVVNRMDLDFSKPIKKHDKLTIMTWPCPARGATMPRLYRVYDDEGQELVRGLGQWSLVDIEEKKILKADTVDFSAFVNDEEKPGNCERFKALDEKMELLHEEQIRYNDIDCNGHMNNANYLRLVQDYISELEHDGYIQSVRIHFAKEALLGQRISLYGYSEMDEESNLTYYFKTLLDDGSLNCQMKLVIAIEK